MGWSVSKKYAAFLSHFKNEAAAEARILKSDLVRTLRAREDQIFLDSDNLSDLRELLNCVVESDALILIYTNSVLTRPWCLLELVTAVQNNVPIITVRAANVFAGDVNDIDGILSNLPAYLAEKNPMAEETLRAFGHDAMSVGNDLRSAFQLEAEQSSQAGTISFDTHQSAAMLQNQVGQIATALVRRACPENRSLLADIESREVEPWPTTRQYAVYIVYDEKSQDITPRVEQIKQWLVDNTDLDENQVLLQGDEAAAEISTTGPMTAVSKHSDSVLLIQSAKVLHEPRSLVCLYAAASHSVPLVPVVLTKSKPEDAALVYDFVAAKSLMENLSVGIGLEASSVLEQATAVPADEVGLALSRVLPNVISKPLGLSSSEGEFNAQMTEVEATLRRSINAGVEQLQIAFKRIDVNGDGSISRDEILRAVRKDRGIGEMLGLRGATGEDMAFEAGRLFEAMDSDGDHHIDLKEFIGYLSGKDQRSIPGDDAEEVTLVPGDARP
jgi:Ca2+-binding EF-hand superfamily protein